MTFNESWQEKGHVGRDPKMTGRGIIFAHRSVIKEAESYLSCKSHNLTLVTMLIVTSPVQPKNWSKKKIKAPCVLDRTKALVITEKHCYIACINACYENPSSDSSRPDLSCLDCLAAGRPLPCSLCLA